MNWDGRYHVIDTHDGVVIGLFCSTVHADRYRNLPVDDPSRRTSRVRFHPIREIDEVRLATPDERQRFLRPSPDPEPDYIPCPWCRHASSFAPPATVTAIDEFARDRFEEYLDEHMRATFYGGHVPDLKLPRLAKVVDGYQVTLVVDWDGDVDDDGRPIDCTTYQVTAVGPDGVEHTGEYLGDEVVEWDT